MRKRQVAHVQLTGCQVTLCVEVSCQYTAKNYRFEADVSVSESELV